MMMRRRRNLFAVAFMGGLMAAVALPAGAQLYAEQVTADNPLTYWRFTNDLQDAQGHLNLDPAVSPNFVTGPGQGNQAYSSSEGKAWAAAFGVDILSGVQDFSYEMWINLKGVNEGKYILQRFAGGTGGGENSLTYANGQITFVGRAGELAEPAVVAMPDQTDAWHHLVMSYHYQSATLIYYVDGQEAARNEEAFLEPILGVQDFEFYIGATRTNPEGRVFNGYLDEVAIYDKALTAAQAAAHFQAAFPGGYAAAVKADNPVIYWRFEGNFNDEVGNNHLLPSGVQFVDGPGGAPNKALFGRVTSNQAQILYNLDDFTYELWFNPKFRSSNSYLFFRRTGGTQSAVIFAYKTDTLEFFSLSDGTRPAVPIPNETDRWYYCVMVNDTAAGEFRIYIDGVLASTTAGLATASAGNQVVVGGSDQGDNFNGYIDEVAVYGNVLTEERIQAHFTAPMNPAGVSEWSLY
ncbi:MAG TPA: LamG domain-containing protein [bacterium]|nr:LamG domain-containing protein [Candidatus Omnitrophota bacterium]HOJ59748.1 LamG domain-containing protein [bacterium]HOL95915.1 LamG domain-containing protein [bacterium]HPP02925.1 LamG domain-containing protein [bacterium]HXK93783.1 LamG domain-containing protein [bacterium]